MSLTRRLAPAPTYDDRQLAARLIRCAKCGKRYYMVEVRRRCQVCRKVVACAAVEGEAVIQNASVVDK